MAPGMERVQIDAARKRGHLVPGEVRYERGRGLLRAAVVDAEVGAPEVERAERGERALADRRRVERIADAVVVRRARRERSAVEQVARVVDADPTAAVGVAGDTRDGAAAQLADEEPAVAAAGVEAGDLALVVERAGVHGRDPEVLAPV